MVKNLNNIKHFYTEVFYLGKAEVLGSSPSRGTIVFPCNSRDLDKPERLNGPPAFVVLSVNKQRTWARVWEILGKLIHGAKVKAQARAEANTFTFKEPDHG